MKVTSFQLEVSKRRADPSVMIVRMLVSMVINMEKMFKEVLFGVFVK